MIGGELYWDGGVSTNTPIDELREDLTADLTRETIVFLVDLWDRKGEIPRSMDEVVWRQKRIQYGSRKTAAESFVENYRLQVQRLVETKKVDAKKVKLLEVCQVMLE